MSGVDARRPAAQALRFLSADAYLAEGPVAVDFVWNGYIARGALTLASGAPKRGKTTLVAALIDAMRRGASAFLGRTLASGPVVWVSEEGRSTLGPRITPGPGLSVLDRRGLFPQRPWSEVVAAAGDEARRIGATLIVFDTFSRWAALGPEAEKDAGAIDVAVGPLLALAAEGFAVLVVHHDRKGGGDDGEAARGSNALLANVDCHMQLPRRDKDEDPSPRRTLVAVSRWEDTTPEALVYQRQGDGELVALAEGARGELKRETLAGRVFDATPEDGSTVDAKTIADALGISVQRAREGLAALVRDERLVKIERPAANAPHLFHRPVETPLSQPPLSTPVDGPSSPSTQSPLTPVGGGDSGDDSGDDETPPSKPTHEDWRELLPEGWTP